MNAPTTNQSNQLTSESAAAMTIEQLATVGPYKLRMLAMNLGLMTTEEHKAAWRGMSQTKMAEELYKVVHVKAEEVRAAEAVAAPVTQSIAPPKQPVTPKAAAAAAEEVAAPARATRGPSENTILKEMAKSIQDLSTQVQALTTKVDTSAKDTLDMLVLINQLAKFNLTLQVALAENSLGQTQNDLAEFAKAETAEMMLLFSDKGKNAKG